MYENWWADTHWLCLTLQAYYLAAPFAIERAPTTAVKGVKARRRGVSITQLAEYPVHGLVFEAGDSLAAMAELVGEACVSLTRENIPHNLFVADCGARVFLLPNCFAERKARGQVRQGCKVTQGSAVPIMLSSKQPVTKFRDCALPWHLFLVSNG